VVLEHAMDHPVQLYGESLPLGPTACGPTPSCGGFPRNAPDCSQAYREHEFGPVSRASPLGSVHILSPAR
jgi:hypothetical protein